MAYQIDLNSYASSTSYRARQAESFWYILDDVRGEINSKDRLLDVGCGGPVGFKEKWLQEKDKCPGVVVGLDIYTSPSNPLSFKSKDQQRITYTYSENGFKDWTPADKNAKFTLITALNSWHWILPGNSKDEDTVAIYKKAANLLEDGGHLAILHRLSSDPCPEMTKIALQAMANAGIVISENEYRGFRKSTWKVPENTKELRKWTQDVQEFNEEIVLQITTWQTFAHKDLWQIWSSANLPALQEKFKERFNFDEDAKKNLRESFNSLDLKSIDGIKCFDAEGEIRVRLTMHAAVQILQKKESKEESRERERHWHITLDPSVPTRVRSHVAIQAEKFLDNNPWFGKTRDIDLSETAKPKADEDKDLIDTLDPLLKSLRDAEFMLKNAAIRSPRGRQQNNISIIFDSSAQDEKNYLLKQKEESGDRFLTLSELSFAVSKEAPQAVFAFTGNSWKGFKMLAKFREGISPVWIRGEINENPINLIKAIKFETKEHLVPWMIGNYHDDLLHAYWLDFVDLEKLPYMSDFLWFLLLQADAEREKRTALCISSCRSLTGIKYNDSVSITVVPPRGKANYADYFIIADALQTYTLIQEAIDSKNKGRLLEFERWSKLLGHELTKDWSYAASVLEQKYFCHCTSEQQKMIRIYCRQLFISGTSWTLTEKDAYERNLLSDTDLYTESFPKAINRLCKNTWKNFSASRAVRVFKVRTVTDKERKTQFAAFKERPFIVTNSWSENASEKWDTSVKGCNKSLLSRIAEYISLIISVVVQNAFKHSIEVPNTRLPEEKISVHISIPESSDCIKLKVGNKHNYQNKGIKFQEVLKKLQRRHNLRKGTFAALEILSREFCIKIDLDYEPVRMFDGFSDETHANLEISFPICIH